VFLPVLCTDKNPHPDAQTAFDALAEAYETLGSPAQRARYNADLALYGNGGSNSTPRSVQYHVRKLARLPRKLWRRAKDVATNSLASWRLLVHEVDAELLRLRRDSFSSAGRSNSRNGSTGGSTTSRSGGGGLLAQNSPFTAAAAAARRRLQLALGVAATLCMRIRVSLVRYAEQVAQAMQRSAEHYALLPSHRDRLQLAQEQVLAHKKELLAVIVLLLIRQVMMR
jgi:predicted DNA-binding ribbon-helix-helix protein